MRSSSIAVGLVALLLAASGCAAAGGEPADGKAVRVVATTTVLRDFATVVGGDRVAVTGLLEPGVDAHDFSPSPADLNAIAAADVLVANGAGLEEWLDDTIDSAGFEGERVDAAAGVELRTRDGVPDPHIWLSAANAKVMVAGIERALAAADPAGAGTYRANLDAYVWELDRLDREVARRIGALPSNKLVTNHDAFGYYADRYGLEVVGAVIPSFDSNAEASGKDLTDLVALVRSSGARAVFAERSLPSRAAGTVAREAGVPVVAGAGALYGDGLGPPGSGAATYLEMMRHNTSAIAGALGGA